MPPIAPHKAFPNASPNASNDQYGQAKKIHKLWKPTKRSDDMVLLNEFGQKIVLPKKNEIIIGRKDHELFSEPDIDTSCFGGAAQGISAHHAMISQESKIYVIVDLNSKNGTYVNRKRLLKGERHLLRVGDEIRLGRIRFIFTQS